jgi:hypothetical protein
MIGGDDGERLAVALSDARPRSEQLLVHWQIHAYDPPHAAAPSRPGRSELPKLDWSP